MAYSFEQVFAADPSNPSNVAQNASITIFAPGDGTMTPIAITDPDGQPLANPIPVNANGFGSAFMADIDRVAWAGGGFTGFFTSYEGMKAEAVAARAAAETAASTAGAEAAVVADAAVAAIIADADAAATSAATAASNASASATAAANSAALVGAPADTAIAAAINGTGATKTALDATILEQGNGAYARAGARPSWLTAAGAVNPYDPRINVYNWKTSNTRKYRAALGKALAGTGRCEIVCAGESTTAGQGVGSSSTELAFPAVIRNRLANAGVPIAGKGAGFASHGNGTVTLDPQLVFTGTWTRPARKLYAQCNSVGATVTLTATLAAGSGTAQIVTSNFGTGSYQYTVDGGAPVTITANNTSTLNKIAINGLAAGSHTIVITNQTTANMYLYSMEIGEASGLIVTNAGASGSLTSDWSDADFSNNGSHTAQRAGHLVIFGLAINDLAAAVDTATYKSRIQTAVQKFLDAGSNVVLTTSNPASGSFTGAQFDDYNKAIYELADTLDLPIIDMSARFPSYSETNTLGLMADNYHPNAAWHAARGLHHAQLLMV